MLALKREAIDARSNYGNAELGEQMKVNSYETLGEL